MRHVWFVGDEMLEKAANTLRKLKNEPIFDASKPELFIYKEYHVEAFHDSEIKPTFNNPMRKVRNNLTMALNKYPSVLPQYLVVILGNSYIHDHAFVDFKFKTILKRIMNDITRLLSSRKEQMPQRTQNVLLSPEVFLIRPLPKPEIAIRFDKKFNMIDKLSRTFNFKPLNIDEINCSQRILFEKNGQLSDYGYERMWSSISQFIKKKDQQLLLAVTKCCAAKEDAATQFPEATHEPEKVEEFYTRRESAAQGYRPSSGAQGDDRYWDNHRSPYLNHQNQRGYERFDDYHKRYDRAGYEDDSHSHYYQNY